MPARIRDAIVVLVLLAAGVAAMLAWHPLGRWAALIVAFAGVLIAAGVYRARRPAFQLRAVRRPPEEPQGQPDPAASTRRPA